jgi:hypothetical protein
VGAQAEGIGSVKVVVCDTGPILDLREAEALELSATAGEVMIAPAVERAFEPRLSKWPTCRSSWLRVTQISDLKAQCGEEWIAIGGRG